jgi:uncharacterized protein YecT (DUF1311 family)
MMEFPNNHVSRSRLLLRYKDRQDRRKNTMKLSRLLPLLPCFGLIALLPHSAGAAAFDCTKARTQVEVAICSDPALSKADEALSEHFNAVLAASNHKESVKAGERAWLRFRDQACDMDSGQSQQVTIIACLKEAIHLRAEFLGPDGMGNRPDDPNLTNVPARWWGTDIKTLMESRYFRGKQASFSVLSIGTGLGGHLIAEITVARQGAEKRSPGDTLAVDLFSGAIVGSDLDDPALADLAGEPDPWRRHGVIMHSTFSREVALDSTKSVRSQISNCDEPFSASLGLYDVGQTRDSGDEVYLVAPRRTSRKIVHRWDDRHCATESKDDDVWTVDFDTLPQFPVLTTPDNSVVVLANTPIDADYRAFIIRYTKDLTSRFFDGREDLLLVDSDSVVDQPTDANSPDAARAANNAAFAKARADQIAKMKP